VFPEVSETVHDTVVIPIGNEAGESFVKELMPTMS